MGTDNFIKIQVYDAYEQWYDNAFIENDHDALLVAKYYRDTLGYKVRVIKDSNDITFMLDSMKVVKVTE